MATDLQATPPLPREPARSDLVQRSEPLLLAVALAAAAGVIHVRAGIEHAEHYWLFGVLFGALALAQLLWALWIYHRPDDERTLMAGAIVSLAAIAVWLVSRIVGLPIGPWAGQPERLGIADISASLDELVLAGVVFALLRPHSRFGAAFGWLRGAHCGRAAIALCSLSVMALAFGEHTHGSKAQGRSADGDPPGHPGVLVQRADVVQRAGLLEAHLVSGAGLDRRAAEAARAATDDVVAAGARSPAEGHEPCAERGPGLTDASRRGVPGFVLSGLITRNTPGPPTTATAGDGPRPGLRARTRWPPRSPGRDRTRWSRLRPPSANVPAAARRSSSSFRPTSRRAG